VDGLDEGIPACWQGLEHCGAAQPPFEQNDGLGAVALGDAAQALDVVVRRSPSLATFALNEHHVEQVMRLQFRVGRGRCVLSNGQDIDHPARLAALVSSKRDKLPPASVTCAKRPKHGFGPPTYRVGLGRSD
jgi:hypothetical protein